MNRLMIDNELTGLLDRVELGEINWVKAADIYNKKRPNEPPITNNILRKRAIRARSRREEPIDVSTISGSETEVHYENGDVMIERQIFFNPNEKKTPETILLKFGYDPAEWKLKKWVFGKWEVAIKDEAKNRVCTTIRAYIQPRTPDDLLPEDFAKLAKEAFDEIDLNPAPIPVRKYKNNNLASSKLMEIPPLELHLGKRAHMDDVPEAYDIKIAGNLFEEIFDAIIYKQQLEECEKCLLVIGGDFFNSEFNNATTNGTPIQNDGRFKKVFKEGIRLYSDAINRLAEHFEQIDVILCVGNHARAMEFFMYIALQQRYLGHPYVEFSDNYKDTQAYSFGNSAIFFNHGDVNLKRTIKSIPAEFSELWGRSKYRELHLGHLHCEVVVNEDGGMITRRVSSPCATDDWHYTNRFIGAVRKHQIFIWDYENGLSDIMYINFSSDDSVDHPDDN